MNSILAYNSNWVYNPVKAGGPFTSKRDKSLEILGVGALRCFSHLLHPYVPPWRQMVYHQERRRRFLLIK